MRAAGTWFQCSLGKGEAMYDGRCICGDGVCDELEQRFDGGKVPSVICLCEFDISLSVHELVEAFDKCLLWQFNGR